MNTMRCAALAWSCLLLACAASAEQRGSFVRPDAVFRSGVESWTCGNNLREDWEQCDDGDVAAGPNCAANCQFAACGDAVQATGVEECDDGNTVSGDGCESTFCSIEAGYSCSGTPSVCDTTCGDGHIAGGEMCDDGNIAFGDGCDEVCTIELGFECAGAPSVCAATCGDGLRVGPEMCDDNNLSNGDCCTSECQAPPGVLIFNDDMNDTDGGADYLGASAPISVCAKIETDGDIDVYRFTVPEGGELEVETFGVDGVTCPPEVDPQIRARTSTGVQLAVDDDSGVEYCAHIDPLTKPTVRALPGGEYFVQVAASPLANGPVFPYRLRIDVPAVCGDMTVGGTEECDDGNSVSGDGCSATCRAECLDDDEPNGSVATANGPFVAPRTACGSITPTGDVDFFAFNLPTRVDVDIETIGADLVSCNFDSEISLIAPDGVTQIIGDDDDGESNCSRIDAGVDAAARGLPAGQYFVRVNEYQDNAAISGYQLMFRFDAVCGNGVVEGSEACDGSANCTAQCQVGCPNDVEPNNTVANAGPARAIPYDQCTRLTPAGDVDVVALNVPDGADLEIETTDGSGLTCTAMDTVIQLIAPNGSTVVITDDDDGEGSCSRIDPATDTAARGLAGGTYYVRINEFQDNAAIPELRLKVRNRYTATCGNRILDAAEACDDGNVTDGDGCSSACAIEASSSWLTCTGGQQRRIVSHATGLPMAIPDPGTINHAVRVLGTGTIAKAVVRVDSITHGYDADLDLSLVAPSGTVFDLSSDNGNGGDNYTGTTFDSTCATAVTLGVSPFAGCFQPEVSLAPLNGTSRAGFWTLRVADDEVGAVGTLNGWHMGFCINP